MKKQPEFRIIEVKKGNLTTYQAQVKILWWRSFYVSHGGDVRYYYSPSRSKEMEMGYIEDRNR